MEKLGTVLYHGSRARGFGSEDEVEEVSWRVPVERLTEYEAWLESERCADEPYPEYAEFTERRGVVLSPVPVRDRSPR